MANLRKIVFLDNEGQYDQLLAGETVTLASGVEITYNEGDDYRVPATDGVEEIELTGESGTLTNAEFDRVIANPSSVVFSIDGRKYIHNEDASTYISYSNVIYPTTTTKDIKVIYVNTSSEAANYKHWSVEDQEEPSGGLASTATANTYAVRTANGRLKATTPTENDDLTTKAYVDNLVGNIDTALQTLDTGTGV